MRLQGVSASDVGRQRSVNQDNALVTANFFAVADGMGGHKAGEVASSLALDAIEQGGAARRFTSVSDVVSAVREANDAIFESSRQDPELRGMGTTLCALAVVEGDDAEPQLVAVNVGDSRAYLLRRGELTQLTVDHSLVQMMVREGTLRPEDAETHPQRNILTRALGIDAGVEVDSFAQEPEIGDRFLVCSDGLFNEVSAAVIAETMSANDELQVVADELVRRANEGGGRDNITCVLVDVLSGDASMLASDSFDTAATVDTAGDADRTTVVAAVTDVDPGETGLVPPPGGAALALLRSKQAADLAQEETTLTPQGAVTAPPRPAPVPEPATLDAREPDAFFQEPVESDIPAGRFSMFRAIGSIVTVLAVLAAGFFAIGWYANRVYFVSFDNEVVTIYKGRPDGLLWMDPTVVETPQPPVPAAELTEALCDRVNGRPSFTDLAAANRFVESLRNELADVPETAPPRTGAQTVETDQVCVGTG